MQWCGSSFLSKDVRERRRHGMGTGHIVMSMKTYCAVMANDAVVMASVFVKIATSTWTVKSEVTGRASCICITNKSQSNGVQGAEIIASPCSVRISPTSCVGGSSLSPTNADASSADNAPSPAQRMTLQIPKQTQTQGRNHKYPYKVTPLSLFPSLAEQDTCPEQCSQSPTTFCLLPLGILGFSKAQDTYPSTKRLLCTQFRCYG